MIKVMTVFGTRPEAIKMLPIIKEIEKDTKLKNIVVTTGQHKEMLEQVMTYFGVDSDYNLDVMIPNQSLSEVLTRIIDTLEPILKVEQPDIVLVHGDTTTTLAASLCCYFNKILIGHVEAGLRTWDKFNPFPEEINRQLTDSLSDLYFVPTQYSKKNLLRENIDEKKIYITGNTVVDALNYTIDLNYKNELLNEIDPRKKVILLTMHRRESFGKSMEDVFNGINQLLNERDDIEVIFPVHLNPIVQKSAYKYFVNNENVHLIEPLDIYHFHNLIKKSYLILTDSGGIQEEAPSLNIPVLILRNETERPEGVKNGCLKLIGTNSNKIKQEISMLLDTKDLYNKMSSAKNPYGDGKSSRRIVTIIKNYLI